MPLEDILCFQKVINGKTGKENFPNSLISFIPRYSGHYTLAYVFVNQLVFYRTLHWEKRRGSKCRERRRALLLMEARPAGFLHLKPVKIAPALVLVTSRDLVNKRAKLAFA